MNPSVKLKYGFVMFMFGTMGIFVREIGLSSSALAFVCRY